MAVTFKQTAINLRDVISGLFKPEYDEKVYTKWVTNLLADDGLFTQADGALAAPYDVWTASGATLSIDTNRLEISATSGGEGAYQQLVLPKGTYVLVGTITLGTAGGAKLSVGTTVMGTQVADTNNTANTYTLIFEIETTGVYYINFIASGSGTAFLDNISVRESIPELVQNGTFDSDTAWTKGTGWAIGSGIASKTAGATSDLSQTLNNISYDKTYAITLNVSGVTAGNLTPQFGGTALTTITANGNYTFVGKFTTSTILYLSANAAFDGDVDNVSVRELSYELPENTETTHVFASGSRLTPEDGYNVFSDGHVKTVNFTDNANYIADIAIDYRVKL